MTASGNETILIALGANLPSPRFGAPRATLEAALAAIAAKGVRILRRSSWWESEPVPASDQPWYVNGVAAVATALEPVALLRLLHGVEAEFGRIRGARNEARLLDLDLLAYGDRRREGPEPPLLPHPRLADRAFVLLPLAEVAPDWRHPVSQETVRQLIARLPAGQKIRRIEA
ncbi:7,8-dihydro-6-hydroxymethylpterin-pyrophosphokinase [Hypericibacter terrae]|jgi:2-amino-4-hydroxy-6-hydroxymethyldihydropteridine diphosphokinase|uniref:2-amino-4-hydroxy-6-hydroxymethyldihydropteridine pyrophosphokinase n=1 Tax=Hypericibacter terrae TaxID=2602015 RepID=A0A5J6MGW1_9PROT|nr:2-amino-4-hydroxy-6-hydroxymethyldihydropteridine diphosphokinase [Hypericibacter terrae]QEX16724.1 7,8-dihydro-6-hydroxymethylpterin-pyrophosphokinase [Hypericibacter terrae]